MRLRVPPHLRAFLLYGLISLIMTFPLALRMKGHLVHEGDTYFMMWSLWWTKQALLDLHVNPFFTTYAFYPQGISLLYQTYCFFSGLLSIPFQLLFERPDEALTFSYNLLVISSFILGGWGAYLLVDYVVDCKKAAFVAGLIFTFSPFHFFHISHLNLLSLQWIPFSVLFFLRLIRQPTVKSALLAALFLTIIAYSELTYLYFLALFMALFLLSQLLKSPSQLLKKALLLRLAFMALIFALLASPFFYLLQRDARRYRLVMPPQEVSLRFSANPTFFFIPSEDATFYKKAFQGLNHALKRRPEQNPHFLGYVPLLLFFYSLFKGSWRRLGFWLVGSIFFLLLSMGPYLHLLDRVTGVKLPYYYAYHILPFLKLNRTPNRFLIMALLCMAPLWGYGIREMLRAEGLPSPLKKAMPTLLSLFVLLELNQAPLDMKPLHVPSYLSPLAEEQGDYAIYDLPLGHYESSQYLFYQTLHHKRLVEGFYARRPLTLSMEPDSSRNIKYVIIHKKFFPEEGYFTDFDQFFTRALTLRRETEDVKIYEVTEGQAIPGVKYAATYVVSPESLEELRGLVSYGESLMEEGDQESAILFLEKAVEEGERSLRGLVSVSPALRKGPDAQAQGVYALASAVVPLMAQAHGDLALLYEKRGLLNKAEEHRVKASEFIQPTGVSP